jgi:hypothetical protein
MFMRALMTVAPAGMETLRDVLVPPPEGKDISTSGAPPPKEAVWRPGTVALGHGRMKRRARMMADARKAWARRGMADALIAGACIGNMI